MTTRLLLVPVILAALLAVSACNGPTDPSQAPEPRPKGEKTKAELIVGTWDHVKTDPPIWDQVKIVLEFAKDGKFTFRVTDPKTGPQNVTGTYQLDGNTLRINAEPAPKYPAKSWELTIETLTDKELVMISKPDAKGRQERGYYKRRAEM